MPISGVFWSVKELQGVLHVSRQRIFGLAREYDWESPPLFPGIFRGGEGKNTPDAYISARYRADIQGTGRPKWNKDRDLNCPQCGGFAIEHPDPWHYKCLKGHEGKLGRE